MDATPAFAEHYRERGGCGCGPGCTLYADTTDPAGNAICVRTGFEPVEDAPEWLFSSP